MKGIDVTGPPSLPRSFIVKAGGEGDIIVDSESDDEKEDDPVDDLDTARIEEDEDLNNNSKKVTREVVEFGDL